MMLYIYIRGLVGDVFKILPMKESFDAGEDVHLSEYLISLSREMTGAASTFPELAASSEYVKVLNAIQFLANDDFDQPTCKKMVFGALRQLNNIEKQIGCMTSQIGGEPDECI